MTILDTTARRWDRTPTRLISTTPHRVRPAPGLNTRVERAQHIQSAVYDATIGHLMHHPGKRWLVSGASGDDSILKWLTRERHRQPTWSETTLDVARGAARQAYEAFQRWDEHQQGKALGIVAEHDAETAIRQGAQPHPNHIEDADERHRHEPSPRAVRSWTRAPSTPRLRGESRRSLHLLVPCRRVSATEVYLTGAGRLHLRDPLPDGIDIRSCQLVETTRRGTPTATRRYALNVQSGSEVQAAEDRGCPDIGIDLGVVTSIALSDGRRLERPDAGATLHKARDLVQHAYRRCKRGSRQYRKLRRGAGRLRRQARQVNEHWERHGAINVTRDAGLVGIEALALRNMTASGRGTGTAPGSDAKRGLNRRLAEQRLGKLSTTIERRALKDGIDLVAVHPGNTSITCNACGHMDRKSRKSQAEFECTACQHTVHADINASRNVCDRARDRLDAYRARQQPTTGRRGPSSRSHRSKGQGPDRHRATAVQSHSALRQPARAAGPQKGMTTTPKTGPPDEVESCM